MMVFRKRIERQSLQHQDQAAGRADRPNSTPDEQPLKIKPTPDIRVQKKPLKMSCLRRAIRAVFCPKQSGSKKETTVGNTFVAQPSEPEGCQPSKDGSKDLGTKPQQLSHNHQETLYPLQAEEPQRQVASSNNTPAQNAAPDQCKQAQLDLSCEQPAVMTGKAHMEIDINKDDQSGSVCASPSCTSFDALSMMTSQQLQDYLTGLTKPNKDNKKHNSKDAKSRLDPAPTSGASSSIPPSQQLPKGPSAPSTPVTPKVVYHPHLGCRMYNRSNIQPVVVDHYGEVQGMVGEGAFAQVTVVRLPDGTLAAAKVLQTSESEGPLWQEVIAVAAAGEHPSFTKLYGVVEQQPLRTMLYEFVGDNDTLVVTTIQDALDWKGTSAALTRKTWLRIVRNICEGLLHFHSSDYVHCDIKSDNILLYKVNEGKKTRWLAKIIDLGNACLEVAGPWLRIPEHLIDQMYEECPQMAPEVMEEDSHFNKPAEVFALGDLLISIGKAAGIRRLRKLGKRCQNIDFTKRPTMAQICKKMAKHWK